MSFFTNKRIVVTGGTGMIGRRLCERLMEEGAKEVRVLTLDHHDRCVPGTWWIHADLTCDIGIIRETMGIRFNVRHPVDMVFHVAGVKGSVALGTSRAADFLVPHLQMNTNVMEAARLAGVERILVTSSSAVYPAHAFTHYSDGASESIQEVESFQIPYDTYAGWAKLTMELQAQAYNEQYGWNKIAIVRLANVYGPCDNFDPATAMAIPALIARAASGENPLKVWGDADRTTRDYLFVNDCVEGMLLAMEKGANCTPYNLGSGIGLPMRYVLQAIDAGLNFPKGLKAEFDGSKPSGLRSKTLNCEKAKADLGWEATTDATDGIIETCRWYLANKETALHRHNALSGAM